MVDIAENIVVDPAGRGTLASPRTYGQFCRTIFHELRQEPKLYASLSPLSLAVQTMREEATDETLKMLAASQREQQAAMSDLADALVAGIARDLVGSIISIVPVLGGLINAFIDIGRMASSEESDQSKAEQTSACIAALVEPKGAGGTIRPADIFHTTTPGQRSTLGKYLIWANEPWDADRAAVSAFKAWVDFCNTHKGVSVKNMPVGKGAAGMVKLAAIAPFSAEWKQLMSEAAVDLSIAPGSGSPIRGHRAVLEFGNAYQAPADDRSASELRLLRMMRMAIESQYREGVTISTFGASAKVRPVGTGGQELWTSYMDLMLAALKRNDKALWRAFGIYWARHDTGCFPSYTMAGAKSVETMINSYIGMLLPVYEDPGKEAPLKDVGLQARIVVREKLKDKIPRRRLATKIPRGRLRLA